MNTPGSVLLLAVLSSVTHAQTPTAPRVTIRPFSEAGVAVSAYDSAVSSIFAQSAQENPALARLTPYAAILTNSNRKNILALTTVWTWIDHDGKLMTHTLRHNSFFLGPSPIAPSGAKVLLTSTNNWPEETIARSGFVTVGNDRVDAENFESSSEVIVELDTVVFEDGLVIGPDRSETVAFFRARKQAAESVSRATLQMLNRGRDPVNLLSKFARYGETQEDFLGFWYAEISEMLLHTRSSILQRELAEELLRIPNLDHLYRNQ